MRIKTRSQRVLTARRNLVELLLASHPDDCMYCIRNRQCILLSLSSELGIHQRPYRSSRRERRWPDVSGAGLVRDPDKCVLCGKCVRICDERQSVTALELTRRGRNTRVATAFDKSIAVSRCVHCGQCALNCPTAALSEHSAVREVMEAVVNPTQAVIACVAPAVAVSLGEEFGQRTGADLGGKMVTALRLAGFDAVFDLAHAVDLAVIETATDLANRLQSGESRPLITSSCPASVLFLEQFFPDLLPSLSTCRSPQQIMGALVKRAWADSRGLDPERVTCVTVSSCTAGKLEAGRPEMRQQFRPDVDHVLTTREIAQLFRLCGLDPVRLDTGAFDQPFSGGSSAAAITAVSGGWTEAVLRTAHWLMTGSEPRDPRWRTVRGTAGLRESRVMLGNNEVGVAAVSGLGRVRVLMNEIRRGRSDLAFIEIMACEGGCVGGGGQPLSSTSEMTRSRARSLYRLDQEESVRFAHANQAAMDLVRKTREGMGGNWNRALFRTVYQQREVPL
jgi:NADH-quinone oxidoreductase subunit G/NADP-reducing hydrogenase subunit HndD